MSRICEDCDDPMCQVCHGVVVGRFHDEVNSDALIRSLGSSLRDLEKVQDPRTAEWVVRVRPL